MKPTTAFFLCGVAIILGSFLETARGMPAGLQERPIRYEDLEPLYEVVETEGADGNIGMRQARVTCDLLSFQSKWLSVNHSACAARCLAQGRHGGSCEGGICRCR